MPPLCCASCLPPTAAPLLSRPLTCSVLSVDSPVGAAPRGGCPRVSPPRAQIALRLALLGLLYSAFAASVPHRCPLLGPCSLLLKATAWGAFLYPPHPVALPWGQPLPPFPARAAFCPQPAPPGDTHRVGSQPQGTRSHPRGGWQGAGVPGEGAAVTAGLSAGPAEVGQPVREEGLAAGPQRCR